MARGNYAALPPRVSLKAFAPTPGDQGQQGSCVGWASAYAARTLSEARRLEITSRSDINRSVFLQPSSTTRSAGAAAMLVRCRLMRSS
ncbi:hypothetical protein V6L77_05615 [Pannonibacter sp. Pt2-lr]